jgi:phosphoribosylanthranilate isomerase
MTDAANGFLIKICGVTSPGDAVQAAEAGADAIGINFWRGSKRFIKTIDDARRVLAAIPNGVLKVGVFVESSYEEVSSRVAELGLDRAQLHGRELPQNFVDRTWPGGRSSRDILILARGILNRESFDGEGAWEGHVACRLYDAFTVRFGGGGVEANWKLISEHVAECPTARPFLVAGGLTPENVERVIDSTRPDGVDVASGVESSPGRKDPGKVAAFICAARAAAARLAKVPAEPR